MKRELAVYRAIAAHPRTPRAAKVCLGLAVAYLLLPFDLPIRLPDLSLAGSSPADLQLAS